MIGALFSFRGRIGRLQYFLTALGVGFVALLVIGAFFLNLMSAYFGRGAVHGGSLVGLGLAMLLLAPLILWIGLAVQAKRVRDIGWDPILVIPALWAFSFVDSLVAQAVPALRVLPAGHQTIVGMAVSLAYTGCLLFWPGEGSGGVLPSDSDGQDERRPEPTFQPAPQPSAWPVAAARTGFGRRGA